MAPARSNMPGVQDWETAQSTDRAKKAQEYLERHNIFQLFQSLATAIIHKEPEDPRQFVVDQLIKHWHEKNAPTSIGWDLFLKEDLERLAAANEEFAKKMQEDRAGREVKPTASVPDQAGSSNEEEVFFEGTDEEQQAALRLQSIQRGRVARKEVAAKKAAITRSSSAGDIAGQAGEEVFFEGTEEEQQAALRLQSIQRGRVARKEVAAKKAATSGAAAPADAPAQGEEEEVFFEGTDEEQQAALRLQSIQRGRVARKEVAAKKAEASDTTSSTQP